MSSVSRYLAWVRVERSRIVVEFKPHICCQDSVARVHSTTWRSQFQGIAPA